MGPNEAYELVKALKENVKLPVVLHTHSTTGLGPMTLLKAAEAGVDVIDTAISCFSGGTSQPSTETMAYSLRQLGFEVDLDETERDTEAHKDRGDHKTPPQERESARDVSRLLHKYVTQSENRLTSKGAKAADEDVIFCALYYHFAPPLLMT